VSAILDARLKPSRSNISALDRVVATCLVKDPDDRWQSARDLLRELRWIAGGSAIDGGPPQGGSRSSGYLTFSNFTSAADDFGIATIW